MKHPCHCCHEPHYAPHCIYVPPSKTLHCPCDYIPNVTPNLVPNIISGHPDRHHHRHHHRHHCHKHHHEHKCSCKK